jgi:2'-5' RNA ligase
MSDSGTTARLFVALTPPPELLAKVSALQQELRRLLPGPSLRWTRPGQSHLTLRFLGKVDLARLEALTATLATATGYSSSFEVRLCGLGVFPSARRPRVFWLGVQEPTGSLAALQSGVSTVTEAFAEGPTEERFHPHLTLARLQFPDPNTRRILESRLNLETEAGGWTAKEVELIRSYLSSEGARYETVARFPFRGSA